MSPNKRPASGVILLQWVDEHKVRQAREHRRNVTEAEGILWTALRRNGILGLKFRRQQVIEGFVVDFFCNAARLVIEVDGEVHDTSQQEALDNHREAVFEARGLYELRFRNEEVFQNLDGVLTRIRGGVTGRTKVQ